MYMYGGSGHCDAQIKILQIANHALDPRSRHHTVEKEFGSADVSGFGTDIPIVLDMVTANCQFYPVWDCFSGWCACTIWRYMACLLVGMTDTGI